jgi:exodeoxyribonuclease-1
MSEIYFGRAFTYAVTAIDQNRDNANEWYLYDLAIPPESLAALTDEELKTRLAAPPKPIRTIRANGVPIIFPCEEAPNGCKGRDCGQEELERRAEFLRMDEAFRRRLIAAYAAGKEPYPESPHVEMQIYSGFFNQEQHLMDAFHAAPWEDRAAIVEKFRDPRLKAIGRRLIHSERPDLMDDQLRAAHDIEQARRLMSEGDDGPWLGIPRALTELDSMMAAASELEAVLLAEHREFLLARLNEAMAAA